MKELSKNQKLRIVRTGRGLTLEETARKVFLSPSFVLMIEQGKRKVPDEVENILDFDKNIKWYLTIAAALSEADLPEKDTAEALDILDKVLKIR